MSLIFRGYKVSTIKLIDIIHNRISHNNLIRINEDNLYIDIPKCGSSFIKSTIINSDLSLLAISSKKPHSALFRRVAKTKNLDNYNLIAFIKDPIERFCSVIRQKLYNNKFFKRGFYTTSIPYMSPLFTKENVPDLIKNFTRYPYSNLDKHLLPQNYFIEKYIKYKRLKIYNIKDLTNVLMSIKGIEFNNFPSSDISLKTNPNIFNKNSLSKESINILTSYYKKDYNIINNL